MASILVIDDDEQTRSWILEVLERTGYTVVQACNGREGVRRFRNAPTDLVILDIFMPEQEGLGTLRELRHEYLTARVIAISGGGNTGDLSFLTVARLMGARQSLEKPFDGETLLHAVRQELEH